jgi:hypothetical protein
MFAFHSGQSTPKVRLGKSAADEVHNVIQEKSIIKIKASVVLAAISIFR